MRIYPVLIDARPAYLGPGTGSLLLTSIGQGTLLQRLGDELASQTHAPLLILTTFEPPPWYEEAVRTQGLDIEAVAPAACFAEHVASYAPSDCLLIRDSRRVSTEPLDLRGTLDEVTANPMIARHLVVPASTTAGISERILLGRDGGVARIQRYYESVTWPFASGVVCSIAPLASISMLGHLPFDSLPALRATLAASAIPSSDVMVTAHVFDLAQESGLLALVEHVVVGREREGAPLVAPSARVDATAVLRGPVVVEAEAEIGPRTMVIGPAVMAAGSRLGANCVVAHSLVTAGTEVPARTLLRQRVAAPGRVEGRAEDPAPVLTAPLPPGDIEEVRDELTLPSVVFKTPVEIALCLAVLLVLSPLLLLIAVLIKLESRGPILYGDLREGKDGRPFRCWKFRTMVLGADARQKLLAKKNQMDGPQFKMAGDPRVTRIGRVLRPLSLDEIPQLLNVVMGQMSLVGPRPSPFRENQLCIPWREARLSVRPGITGLWQVCRHDRDEGDFHQWIYYDLLYVRHMTPWLDFKILVATALTLAGRYSVPLTWLLSPAKFDERRRQRRGKERNHLSSVADHA